MALWVRNPTTAVWVTVKALVQSPAQRNELKDPVLSQLQRKSQAWIQSLAQELPYALGVTIKLKKKKKTLIKKNLIKGCVPKYTALKTEQYENEQPNLKMAKHLNKHLIKEDIPMTNNYVKRFSVSYVIRKLQNQTDNTTHPLKMTKIDHDGI